MRKNTGKIALITISLLTIILILVVGIAFIVLAGKTSRIKDDYSIPLNSEKYQMPVFVDGVEVIKQDISCGYAVMEMFSA